MFRGLKIEQLSEGPLVVVFTSTFVVLITTVLLLVRRHFWNDESSSNNTNTTETGHVSSSSSTNGPSDKVLLIIDGCNGPIRLDREHFLHSQDKSHSISLLQVVHGENRGTRIPLLQALLKLCRTTGTYTIDTKFPHWQVQIYFDGLGIDKQYKWGMAGREWDWNDRISVKVTPIWEEADNKIVELVQKQQQQQEQRLHTENAVRQEMNLQETFEHCLCASMTTNSTTIRNTPVSNSDQVLLFQRNNHGPGRSRQLVKRLGLMRPESVYCWLPVCDRDYRDLKSLQSIRRLLVDNVVQKSLTSQTIVATDDIFLRQRIVESGGLVMTFEQLWELLVPFSQDH